MVATVVFSHHVLVRMLTKKHFRILGIKEPHWRNTGLSSSYTGLLLLLEDARPVLPRGLSSWYSFFQVLPYLVSAHFHPWFSRAFSQYSASWWDLPWPAHLNVTSAHPISTEVSYLSSCLTSSLKYLLLAHCWFYLLILYFLFLSLHKARDFLSVLFPSTSRFSVNIYWMAE